MDHLLNATSLSTSNVDIIVDDVDNVQQVTSIMADDDSKAVFKKPMDTRSFAGNIGSSSGASNNRTADTTECNAYSGNIGPTREILSCMMTTSGFISPAREGKLPDMTKPLDIFDDPPPNKFEETNADGPKKQSEKQAAKADSAKNEATKSPAVNLKNSSASKKLLLAGIGKEKSANKKRKLLLNQDDRKKVKKKMRLLQAGGNDGAPMAPTNVSPKKKQSMNVHAQEPDYAVPNLSSYPFGPEHNVAIDMERDRKMNDMLAPPSNIKVKKTGERKYKIPKTVAAGIANDLSMKPKKMHKKKTPKLSKKKLLAAIALGFLPESALMGDRSAIVLTDEQLLAVTNRLSEMSQTAMHAVQQHHIGGDMAHAGMPVDSMPPQTYHDLAAKSASNPNDYYQLPPAAIDDYKIHDKLSTEPDKRKLNIFKKISSASATNIVDTPTTSKKSKKNSNGMPGFHQMPMANEAHDFSPIGVPQWPLGGDEAINSGRMMSCKFTIIQIQLFCNVLNFLYCFFS